jgi:hypothetical protein
VRRNQSPLKIDLVIYIAFGRPKDTISPNGKGAYLDFTGTAKGETVKPDLITKYNTIF